MIVIYIISFLIKEQVSIDTNTCEREYTSRWISRWVDYSSDSELFLWIVYKYFVEYILYILESEVFRLSEVRWLVYRICILINVNKNENKIKMFIDLNAKSYY